MNIFVLDTDPSQSARYMCDVHVVKMAVEAAQLLSTQDRLNGLGGSRYQPTHINHPCRVCLQNRNNYVWLCEHLGALLREYSFRYQKDRNLLDLYGEFWAEIVKSEYYNKSELTFPKCMPSHCKSGDTSLDAVVQSYRNYYRLKKYLLPRFSYTIRKYPSWL